MASTVSGATRGRAAGVLNSHGEILFEAMHAPGVGVGSADCTLTIVKFVQCSLRFYDIFSTLSRLRSAHAT